MADPSAADRLLSMYAQNLSSEQQQRAYIQHSAFKEEDPLGQSMYGGVNPLNLADSQMIAPNSPRQTNNNSLKAELQQSQETVQQLNAAILQYEQVLQRLTVEFQSLQQKAAQNP